MELKKKIILSSGSPRRAELLKKAGVPFNIRTKEVDETLPQEVHYTQAAEYLAIKKARAHGDNIAQDEIILTADTIVVHNGKMYGKPTDREDAIKSILKLSDTVHEVYTGVCLRSTDKLVSFTELSLVRFSAITRKEAEYYVDKDNPLDKAGAYGIQDWIGYSKVLTIEGSYTCILGLPMAQTYDAIMNF